MAGRRRTVKLLDFTQLVPGGILETDTWWSDPDPGLCSRCRKYPGSAEVPLLLWSKDRNRILRYCASCTEIAA